MLSFRSPFSRAYWHAATRELSSVRMLALAALVVALRVLVRSLNIPIAESLFLSVTYLPNALGSMVYGPVVALLSGFVTDTLGALLFPMGAYFPPFALVEMTGSLLYALFLYRAKLSVSRVALAKFSVNVICNMLLTPLFLSLMSGKAAVLASLPRIAKNMLMLPVETLLLTLFLGAMLPVLRRMRVTANGQTAVRLSARHYVLLCALLLLSAAALWLYVERFAVR